MRANFCETNGQSISHQWRIAAVMMASSGDAAHFIGTVKRLFPWRGGELRSTQIRVVSENGK
jgi:hypothetical protein